MRLAFLCGFERLAVARLWLARSIGLVCHPVVPRFPFTAFHQLLIHSERTPTSKSMHSTLYAQMLAFQKLLDFADLGTPGFL